MCVINIHCGLITYIKIIGVNELYTHTHTLGVNEFYWYWDSLLNSLNHVTITRSLGKCSRHFDRTPLPHTEPRGRSMPLEAS